jgi:hypothetical protein
MYVCMYVGEVNMKQAQGQVSDMPHSQSHDDALIRGIAFTAWGEVHGVNRAVIYFPGCWLIGNQYDIAPWPVSFDVCSTHIVNRV